jgi:hypothetical protein
VLTIAPANLPDGRVNVEYSFTLTAERIPATVANVTFEWTFGDGTATGSRMASVVNGRASTVIRHTYTRESIYGLVAVVRDGTVTLAQRNAVITIGQPVVRPPVVHDACGVWRAATAGGYGATVDNWDISAIPRGAVFDIRFNAYSIPDKFIVEYPAGSMVLDTGWRGSSAYAGNPLYPGGIAGPGLGEVLDIFTRATVNSFRVTVIGPDPGTSWNYEIRCRIP